MGLGCSYLCELCKTRGGTSHRSGRVLKVGGGGGRGLLLHGGCAVLLIHKFCSGFLSHGKSAVLKVCCGLQSFLSFLFTMLLAGNSTFGFTLPEKALGVVAHRLSPDRLRISPFSTDILSRPLAYVQRMVPRGCMSGPRSCLFRRAGSSG